MRLTGPLRERGVSVVISTILILAVLVAAFSVFYPVYMRSEGYSKEAEHMDAVRGGFLQIKSKVGGLGAGESASVDLTMSAESIPFVPLPRRAGTLSVAPPSIRTVTIYPSDDAYADEAENNTNFGAETFLEVASRTGKNKRSFLKFSLENIPPDATILKAELWLHCDNCESTISDVTDIRCHQISDDEWLENELTWNNQPSMGDCALDSLYVGEPGWISLTVKDFVTQEVGGDGIVSLGLKFKQENYDSTERYVSFSSKEAGANQPYLEVTCVTPLVMMAGSWKQTDWSGGETYPMLESGEWAESYNKYYEGENVDTSVPGEIRLENASPTAYKSYGWLESSIYDAGSAINWGVITWEAETPGAGVSQSWVQTTQEDFEAGVLENVDTSSSPGDVKLARGVGENLIIDGTTLTLGGDHYYDYVRIINGGTLYVESGQVLRIYAKEIYVDSTSSIGADGRGYPGGPRTTTWKSPGSPGSGPGAGGGGKQSGNSDGSGGGGAGYGGEGGDGGNAWGNPGVGEGGPTYGSATDETLEMGSGGGSGAKSGYRNDPNGYGGAGGAGGGAFLLDATTINIQGTLSAKGLDGENGHAVRCGVGHGGGGGGSGGTIILRGGSITMSGTMDADGGDGGASGGFWGGAGGGGGGGRIKIFYKTLNDEVATYSVDGGSNGGAGYVNPQAQDGAAGSIHKEMIAYTPSLPYYPSGTLASQVHDTGADGTVWDELSWSETLQAGMDITFDVRASDEPFAKDNAGPDWTSVGGTSPVTSGLPPGRYQQWRATLSTTDNSNTPTLHDVTVVYTMGAATFVTVKTRTGTDNNPYDGGWSDWQVCTSGSQVPSPDSRYIQYRVELSTENNSITPVFKEMTINYSKPGVGVLAYGTVEFQGNNGFFPNQNYVYEGGAVILIQNETNLMVSKPTMVTASDASGDLIRVNVDLFVIERKKASIASTGTATIRAFCKSSGFTVAPVGGPNRENVVLTISTRYENAWVRYLHDLCEELNNRGYNASLDGLTLTILGKNTDPGVKDIYYHEKVTEIEVSIA